MPSIQGPFVTKAKEEFSNSQNANIQKWSAYIKGDVLRQDYLRIALEWVTKSTRPMTLWTLI